MSIRPTTPVAATGSAPAPIEEERWTVTPMPNHSLCSYRPPQPNDRSASSASASTDTAALVGQPRKLRRTVAVIFRKELNIREPEAAQPAVQHTSGLTPPAPGAGTVAVAQGAQSRPASAPPALDVKQHQVV